MWIRENHEHSVTAIPLLKVLSLQDAVPFQEVDDLSQMGHVGSPAGKTQKLRPNTKARDASFKPAAEEWRLRILAG